MFLERKKFADYIVMSLLEVVDEGLVALVTLGCADSYLDQCVCTSADG